MEKRGPRIDPELMRQVEDAESATAAADQAQVQAVVFLDPVFEHPEDHEPEDVEQLVSRVIHRVQQASGQEPHDVNIFRNLGSFIVQAPPQFLRCLIEQPEIRSARANRSRS